MSKHANANWSWCLFAERNLKPKNTSCSFPAPSSFAWFTVLKNPCLPYIEPWCKHHFCSSSFFVIGWRYEHGCAGSDHVKDTCSRWHLRGHKTSEFVCLEQFDIWALLKTNTDLIIQNFCHCYVWASTTIRVYMTLENTAGPWWSG